MDTEYCMLGVDLWGDCDIKKKVVESCLVIVEMVAWREM
jgi:hypothetical protein